MAGHDILAMNPMSLLALFVSFLVSPSVVMLIGWWTFGKTFVNKTRWFYVGIHVVLMIFYMVSRLSGHNWFVYYIGLFPLLAFILFVHIGGDMEMVHNGEVRKNDDEY